MVLDVLKTLKETEGIPFAYDHFAEGESPNPPFAVYLYPGTNNFAADGIVYFPVNKVSIELYTDKKEPETEQKLERLLMGVGIFYEKSEVWIASERLYEVIYSFEEVGYAPEVESSSGSLPVVGHSHSNLETLDKLSTDSKGNLLFNGKLVGDTTYETAYSITLTETHVAQKYVVLPADCDTSKAITLSLNGLDFPRGEAWDLKKTGHAIIVWDGLELENFVQVGDTILISHYRRL